MVFRILKVHDDVSNHHKHFVADVAILIKTRFPDENPAAFRELAENMRDPVKKKLRSVLFVVTDVNERLLGFALLYHSSKPDFCYLDYLAADPSLPGRGIGGALYERLREECLNLKTGGLFFECLPDDAVLSPNPTIRKQNARRLAFYERYGAFPIVGTAYETPVKEGDTDPPYLVYDNLGVLPAPDGAYVREVMKAILERKYDHLCPPEYVEKVTHSVKDGPVTLRPPLYVKADKLPEAVTRNARRQIPVAVNWEHSIHHVRERGYVESPVRVRHIWEKLKQGGMCRAIPVRHYPEKLIRAVHDDDFVTYLKKMTQQLPDGKSLYPYVFPIRNAQRKPNDMPIRAGYYCIDTFTPLHVNAYKAAVRAVDCALTAADEVLQGQRFAYALVRPPGHHAERRSFGGFCYLNSNAIAAHYLSAFGKVAILDVDYHHGNGQQDIFYPRDDVLTISIHGHPNFAYPYFTGFANETGEGKGKGYNLNIPLKENIKAEEYFAALSKAIRKIRAFAPDFLIVALGLDTAKGDPTGTWQLVKGDFTRMATRIASLDIPTLIVQEGGYRTHTLGTNAQAFFSGLYKSF